MNDYDLIVCSDGYHHYRGVNPIAINTFLMYGKIEYIKKINIDLSNLKYFMILKNSKYSWKIVLI